MDHLRAACGGLTYPFTYNCSHFNDKSNIDRNNKEDKRDKAMKLQTLMHSYSLNDCKNYFSFKYSFNKVIHA